MGNDEVALRGPVGHDQHRRGRPDGRAALARGLFGYHLDFPGDALQPGCTYEEWSSAAARPRRPRRPTPGSSPRRTYPGRLALQYWFFYVFNDWNNTHEGDWEMIQLNFDAATPGGGARARAGRGRLQPALERRARRRGATRSSSCVDGTHPVVYPAPGSQRQLLRLAALPDALRGRGRRLRRHHAAPRARSARSSRPCRPPRPTTCAVYPWLGLRRALGRAAVAPSSTAPPGRTRRPSGPSRSPGRRRAGATAASRCRPAARSAPARPTSSAARSQRSSLWLRDVKANPGIAALVIGGLGVLLLWGLSRTAWEPAAPLPRGRAAPLGPARLGRVAHATGAGRGSSSASACCSCPSACSSRCVQFLVFRVTEPRRAGRRGRRAQRVRRRARAGPRAAASR